MSFIETVNQDILRNKISPSEQFDFIKQVRRWGGLNTDAVLDPACKIFTTPTIEGFIGYRVESKCAVVFGDPVCASTDKYSLAKAFKHYCEEQKLNVIYVIASKEFANLALYTFCQVQIQFGDKLIINPSIDPLNRKGPKGVLIRKKVKHALKESVKVSEYESYDPALEKAIEQIGKSWLQSRHGPQVYIAHLNFFTNREGKRYFFAKQGEKIIGFLILNELQSNNGWLLNNLMITKDAPHGTSETLIISTFKALEQEKCKYVTMGPVTAKQLDSIVGLGFFSTWSLQLFFKVSKRLFNLDGQTIFWEKFQPEHEPSFLLFDKVNFRTIKALMRAMNVSFYH